MRQYLAVIFAISTLGIPWFVSNYPNQVDSIITSIQNISQTASIIVSHNPKSISEIQGKGNDTQTISNKKVRILIVPGHEPNYGGAEFGTVTERDMAMELANDLHRLLNGNPRYEVFTTRTGSAWDKTFSDYFTNSSESILEWRQAHVNEILDLIKVGKFKPYEPLVYHNNATTDVMTRLYGIDKWVNENDIDIVIHIHFNDNPRRRIAKPGEHSGFAIYVPEKQYDNSTTTQVLADTVFKRLSKYNPVSDLPGEDSGIVEEQELIAIGPYNSVDAASMLIEYGYIYEPQFQDREVRALALNDLAFETYLGLEDFFRNSAMDDIHTYDTSILPYHWGATIGAKSPISADTFALQTALIFDGSYPPSDKNKNDCPRTGKLGPCTKVSLQDFQNRNKIKGENGVVGKKTIEALNRRFGVRSI